MKNGEASLLRYSLDCNVTSYIKSCACVCVSVRVLWVYANVRHLPFGISSEPAMDRQTQRERDRETDCGNEN